ncbi:CDN_1a_G0015340.mRNA.1.CDS.1 [Saccharomyces cerevisiae]|nr:Aim9p [Saccharomyces cerevisiae YJM1190]AJU43601.1 Aim9p [Saccharomyces cerevisiae YJM1199]CAI4430414.1 CCC_1a_G0015420.mRNA.1.CDS.1 [Saccharomyces cerevisiae]CAI4432422.1 CDN_1a_G0015340.mRNA.1.CDS.1 [Saccharomyces cerevisiae]CAI7262726.1 CCC_1a_G0015420.mRNA.1.CDS.1 [Saccharomyces cerevisiae]
MIRYTVAGHSRRCVVGASKRVGAIKCITVATTKRFISNKPNEVFTKLTNDNDPKRDAFFKYTWGSWLKNDKQEKEKRFTKFSIEGLNRILNDIYIQSNEMAKAPDGKILPPMFNKNLTVSLVNNVVPKNIGKINPNEKVQVTTLSSIHEGKHHRIYKVDTNLNKAFILRIPYPLENENTLSYRIRSEVATMDFADLKLGIKVPKIFCYGVNSLNPVRQPFVLQEFIEGELLMKDWDPLIEDGSSNQKKYDNVIKQVSDFQSKLVSLKLNAFGSIYFNNDLKDGNEKEFVKEDIYDGETNPDLQNRWKIGPSVERCLWRHKSHLDFHKQMKPFLGPWPKKSPMDIIKNTGLLEAENAKTRIAMKEAGSSAELMYPRTLKEQITTYENLAKIAPDLFNVKTKAIPNMQELLSPRLFHPDLDPMNIIVNKEAQEAYLLDFEGACTKPFILQNSPQFIAYDGPKIYDLKEDITDFDKLSEAEKAQYQFMYKRTRNQHQWEKKLNDNNPKLITAVAPPVKLLRSPYIAAVERKTEEEYLLIDESLLQLKEVWDIFAQNDLVNQKKFPLNYSKEDIERHVEDLQKLHEKLISTPFAATQGWIPQDMFDQLLSSGSIVKQENGDYTVKQPKATK